MTRLDLSTAVQLPSRHFVLARKRRRVTVPWYSRLPVSPEALAVFRASAAIEFWLGGDV